MHVFGLCRWCSVVRQDVAAIEKVADEWVTNDLYDYERRITAELEAKLQALTDAVRQPSWRGGGAVTQWRLPR